MNGPAHAGAGGIRLARDPELSCDDRKEPRAEAGLILGPESSGKIWRARAGSCGEGLAWCGGGSHGGLGPISADCRRREAGPGSELRVAGRGLQGVGQSPVGSQGPRCSSPTAFS